MARVERWIYRDMIEVYYDTEKPLSLDVDELCHVIGVRTEDDRKIVVELLRYKFQQAEDGFRHVRCDNEIAAYHAKAETAKANGRRGGRPSKQKANPEKPSGFQSGSDSVATGNPIQTGSQTNQEPRTKNQEPVLKTTPPATPSALPDLFEGIPPQLVADFKKLRDKKKAPITKTAIDGIQREASKAGLNLEDALRISCERGWTGFKADWLAPPNAHVSPAHTPLDLAAAQRAANQEAKRRLGIDDGRTIDAP